MSDLRDLIQRFVSDYKNLKDGLIEFKCLYCRKNVKKV